MRSLFRTLCAALCIAATPALALAYPERPVEIVVTYPAGGGTDTIARILAESLSETLGGTFLVINKPGASGKIGLNYTSRAKPDGHVVILDAGMTTSRPAVDPTYQISSSDFQPISLLATAPLALIADARLGIESVEQLIDAAKDTDRHFFYASLGPGSGHNLIAELFKKRAGIQLEEVPYLGGAQAVNDLVAGRVQFMFSNLAPFVGQAQLGKVKVLAVAGDSRIPEFPDAPTLKELGFDDVVLTFWYGVLAPKGTDPSVVDTLNNALLKAAKDPKVVQSVATMGIHLKPVGTSDFTQMLKDDSSRWEWLAREVGFEPLK